MWVQVPPRAPVNYNEAYGVLLALGGLLATRSLGACAAAPFLGGVVSIRMRTESKSGVSALSRASSLGSEASDFLPDFVSCELGTIGKSLSLDADQRGFGALRVGHCTLTPTEVELIAVLL
jgi:hypothetical protein